MYNKSDSSCKHILGNPERYVPDIYSSVLYICRTLGRMQECYQLVFPGQAPVVKKGHIEQIDISVASRGSNKKVPNF